MFHDQASKGYGLTSQTSLHECLQRLTTMQILLWCHTRNRPMPLTSSVMEEMMARFCDFYSLKKSRFSLKRLRGFPTCAKIFFKRKKHFGVSCTSNGCICLYHSKGWMLCIYFVWVLVPPLLGGFWCQWLQLGAEMNEWFVQVDAEMKIHKQAKYKELG